MPTSTPITESCHLLTHLPIQQYAEFIESLHKEQSESSTTSGVTPGDAPTTPANNGGQIGGYPRETYDQFLNFLREKKGHVSQAKSTDTEAAESRVNPTVDSPTEEVDLEESSPTIMTPLEVHDALFNIVPHPDTPITEQNAVFTTPGPGEVRVSQLRERSKAMRNQDHKGHVQSDRSASEHDPFSSKITVTVPDHSQPSPPAPRRSTIHCEPFLQTNLPASSATIPLNPNQSKCPKRSADDAEMEIPAEVSQDEKSTSFFAGISAFLQLKHIKKFEPETPRSHANSTEQLRRMREAAVTTRMAMYQHEIAAFEDWSVAPPDELRAGSSPDTGPTAQQQTIHEKPTDAFWRSTSFLPIEQSYSVSNFDAMMENQWDWNTNPNGDEEASDSRESSGKFTQPGREFSAVQHEALFARINLTAACSEASIADVMKLSLAFEQRSSTDDGAVSSLNDVQIAAEKEWDWDANPNAVEIELGSQEPSADFTQPNWPFPDVQLDVLFASTKIVATACPEASVDATMNEPPLAMTQNSSTDDGDISSVDDNTQVTAAVEEAWDWDTNFTTEEVVEFDSQEPSGDFTQPERQTPLITHEALFAAVNLDVTYKKEFFADNVAPSLVPEEKNSVMKPEEMASHAAVVEEEWDWDTNPSTGDAEWDSDAPSGNFAQPDGQFCAISNELLFASVNLVEISSNPPILNTGLSNAFPLEENLPHYNSDAFLTAPKAVSDNFTQSATDMAPHIDLAELDARVALRLQTKAWLRDAGDTAGTSDGAEFGFQEAPPILAYSVNFSDGTPTLHVDSTDEPSTISQSSPAESKLVGEFVDYADFMRWRQLEAVAESQSGAVDSKSWDDPVEPSCVNTTPIVDCFEPQDSWESLVPQPEEETAEKAPPKTNRSLFKLARVNVKGLFDGHGHKGKAEFTLESVEPDQRFMMYLAMMDQWHTEVPGQEKSFDLSYLTAASSTANRTQPSIYHSFPAVNRSESSASSGVRDKESSLQVNSAVEQSKPEHQIGIVSDLDAAQGML